MWAGVAIALYPVGLWVLNLCLLRYARTAIQVEGHRAQSVSTAKSVADSIAFLHRDYQPTCYLWELMEMGRRFVLVGLLIVGPFHQGSVMQVAMANLVSMVYLFLQLLAMPYRKRVDNYLAHGCSLSLAVMLLCAVIHMSIAQ